MQKLKHFCICLRNYGVLSVSKNKCVAKIFLGICELRGERSALWVSKNKCDAKVFLGICELRGECSALGIKK